MASDTEYRSAVGEEFTARGTIRKVARAHAGEGKLQTKIGLYEKDMVETDKVCELLGFKSRTEYIVSLIKDKNREILATPVQAIKNTPK